MVWINYTVGVTRTENGDGNHPADRFGLVCFCFLFGSATRLALDNGVTCTENGGYLVRQLSSGNQMSNCIAIPSTCSCFAVCIHHASKCARCQSELEQCSECWNDGGLCQPLVTWRRSCQRIWAVRTEAPAYVEARTDRPNARVEQ